MPLSPFGGKRVGGGGQGQAGGKGHFFRRSPKVTPARSVGVAGGTGLSPPEGGGQKGSLAVTLR
jgi:hypothetical protein